MNARVAVVTGAGRGIGREIALSLAADGIAVVAVSRTRAEIQEAATLIQAAGGRALAIVADVSDPQAVASMTRTVLDACGRIDILINGAAVLGPIGPLADSDVSQWITTLHINLVGVFLCCRAVIPAMAQAGGGVIVNVSGGGATAPFPGFSAYASSKAAVVRLTETLAEELRPVKIRVNAIAPGSVDTKLFREAAAIVPTVPASLAASLVSFLVSDRSAGMTGRLIAAKHDDWQHWHSSHIERLMDGPWLTLRRIDRHTLDQLQGQPGK